MNIINNKKKFPISQLKKIRMLEINIFQHLVVAFVIVYSIWRKENAHL